MGVESIIDPHITAHLIERFWTPQGAFNLVGQGYIIESLDFLYNIYQPILQRANQDNPEWSLSKEYRMMPIEPIIPQITVYPIKEMIEFAATLDIEG